MLKISFNHRVDGKIDVDSIFLQLSNEKKVYENYIKNLKESRTFVANIVWSYVNYRDLSDPFNISVQVT